MAGKGRKRGGTWDVDSVDAAMENGVRGLKKAVEERGKWTAVRPLKAVGERNLKIKEGGATVAIVHQTPSPAGPSNSTPLLIFLLLSYQIKTKIFIDFPEYCLVDLLLLLLFTPFLKNIYVCNEYSNYTLSKSIILIIFIKLVF